MVHTRGVKCADSGCALFGCSKSRFCSEHSGAEYRVQLTDTASPTAFLECMGEGFSFYSDAEMRTIAHSIRLAGFEETPLQIQWTLMSLRRTQIGLNSKTQFLTVEQATVLMDRINNNAALSDTQKYHFDNAVTYRTFSPWSLKGISRYAGCTDRPVSKVALSREWLKLKEGH
jgi:hypothetical protein